MGQREEASKVLVEVGGTGREGLGAKLHAHGCGGVVHPWPVGPSSSIAADLTSQPRHAPAAPAAKALPLLLLLLV